MPKLRGVAPDLTREESVVLQIQKENGVDEASNRKAREDPELALTLKNLKNTVAVTLDLLSDELYTKPAHCVLEMIQNADDNLYPEGVTPELQITLCNSHMEVHCNEVGFTDANVRAFCGIRKSTKKNQSGYIGEKGIGAKSIFKVAKVVTIQSQGYAFELDREAELGMISPAWRSDLSVRPGWTTMRLEFIDGEQYKVIRDQLRDIRGTVLLFLRKLCKLYIDDGEQFSVTRSIKDDIIQLVTVTTAQSGETKRHRTRYLKVSHVIAAASGEEKRASQAETEIVLAFPLDSDYLPLSKPTQMVHAFLPLRCVGLRFLLQADFLTAANREDILIARRWNVTIRDSIARAFLSAVPLFKQYDGLSLTWPRFLPRENEVSHAFFAQASKDVRELLKTAPIILCEDNKWRCAEMTRLRSGYCGADGQPLVAAKFIRFAYISPDYAKDVVDIFQTLGLKALSYDDFVDGLLEMHDAEQFHKMSLDWLENICQIIFRRGVTTTYVKRLGHLRTILLEPKIRRLPLAQRRNKSWSTCSEAQTAIFFFDDSSCQFPAGLGIEVLRMHDLGPQRREVLKYLGVRSVDPDLVVTKILSLHNHPSLDVNQILSHVMYLFEQRHAYTREIASHVWLLDQSGSRTSGSGLYMDDPSSTTQLSTLLRAPAAFIHPSFMQAFPKTVTELQPLSAHHQFCAWLRTVLKVATIPRVTTNGTPSPEFATLMNELRLEDPERLLSLLRAYGPKITRNLSTGAWIAFQRRVSHLEIRCSDGTVHRLDGTYFLNDALRPFLTADMPTLPIPQSEVKKDWSILRGFGVSLDVNAEFFMKQLRAMAQSGQRPSVDTLAALYRHIESRFHELPDVIRNSFKDSKLIFMNRSWVSIQDVVWDGPSIMSGNRRLRLAYPHLQTLFSTHLGIPSATDDIVKDELRQFVEAHKNGDLRPADLERLNQLLVFANSTIEKIQRNALPDWTSDVRDLAIFPVRLPSRQVQLAGRSETFYIPDSTGELEELFAGKVPFLNMDRSAVVPLRPLLAKFGMEDKRIDRFVTRTVTANGQPIQAATKRRGALDKKETEFYQSRMKYFQRVYYYKKEKTLPVRGVRVFKVQTLDVSYSVEGGAVAPISNVIDCWANIDEDSGQLWVFLADTIDAMDRRNYVVAGVLAQALSLISSAQLVRCIIHETPRDIAQAFKLDGIHELPAEHQHVDDEVDELDQDELEDEPQQPEIRPQPNGAVIDIDDDDVGGDDVAATPAIVDDEAPQPPAPARGLNGSTAPDETEPRRRIRRSDAKAEPEDLDAYLNGPDGREEVLHLEQHAARTAIRRAPSPARRRRTSTTRARRSSHPQPARRPRTRNSTAAEAVSNVPLLPEQIHFLGDKFVFDVFRSQLPDFTSDNWTSASRRNAGFPAFIGESTASFQYTDHRSTLSRILFPNNATLRAATSEYFIEVKSTAGEGDEPFEMTRQQFEHARTMTFDPNSDVVPERVYVLVRVCNLGHRRPPRYTLHVDPHDLLTRGLLRIESETVDVRILTEDAI